MDHAKKQEIFTKGLEFLRKQGCAGFDVETATCSYLTSDGKRCWIGALLPEHLAKKAEAVANNAGSTVLNNKEIARIFDCYSEEGRDWLNRLQAVHDNAAVEHGNFLENLEHGAKLFAERHRLEYSAP